MMILILYVESTKKSQESTTESSGPVAMEVTEDTKGLFVYKMFMTVRRKQQRMSEKGWLVKRERAAS